MAKSSVVLGPFSGGLNIYDDPTAVRDNELVESVNWDQGLDGSLISRPPIGDTGVTIPTAFGLNYVGSALGWHFFTEGYSTVSGEVPQPGTSFKTLAWNGSSTWVTLSTNMQATAVVAFNGVIWIVASASGLSGGWMTTAGVFTYVSNMPYGTTLTEYKGRLFLGGVPSQPLRVYYSKTFAESDIWGGNTYITVSGEGGSVKQVVTYYNSLLIFRQSRIDTFSYSTAVAQGILSLLIPDIGTDSNCVMLEGSIFFRKSSNAYQLINNNVQPLNQKVPFVTDAGVGSGTGGVAQVGKRIVFSFSGTMYVYNTITRTWSTWETSRGPLQPFFSVGEGLYYATESRFDPTATPNRRNFALNGNLRTDTSGWNDLIAAGGAGTVSRVASSYVHEGAPIGAVARLTCTTAIGTNFYLRYGYDVSTYIRVSAIPAGQTYTVSALVFQQSSVSKTMNLIIDWRDGGGASLGLTVASATVAPGVNTRLVTTAVAPGGTNSISVRIGTSSGVAVGDYVQGSCVVVENSAVDAQKWFDDQRPADSVSVFSRLTSEGVLENFPRYVAYPNLNIKLFPFADQFASFGSPLSEDFSCEMLTKNYDFQQVSSFKRLFWWGVDAVVDKRFRGWALPVNGAEVETINTPLLEERRNLALNPLGIAGGDTTDWQAATSGWAVTFPGLGARFSCTSAQSSASRGFNIRGNALRATPLADATWNSIPVQAGYSYTISVWTGSNRPLSISLTGRVHDGAGTWLDPAVQGSQVPVGGQASVTVVPSVDGFLVVSALFAAGIIFIDGVDWYEGFQLLIEEAPAVQPYFDGDTTFPSDPTLVTRWLGTPYASISVAERELWDADTTRRFLKMFKSLRFRQIAFRLNFDADGLSPLKLFSLAAFVSTKETVSERAN